MLWISSSNMSLEETDVYRIKALIIDCPSDLNAEMIAHQVVNDILGPRYYGDISVKSFGRTKNINRVHDTSGFTITIPGLGTSTHIDFTVRTQTNNHDFWQHLEKKCLMTLNT